MRIRRCRKPRWRPRWRRWARPSTSERSPRVPVPDAMSFPLTAEPEALRAKARELADGVFAERAARWDAREEYPWDNVKDLVAAGFMGMTVPAAQGGGERPLLDVVLVIEEIARACGITGRIVVEGNLGTVGALIAYGTEAQKRRYFPWVLEGEKPAIAISEPAAGS